MKTILQIIEEAGGLPKAGCISIDNEPWMRLVIEVLPERGPDGHVVVSVAHYGEQNSDAMRDPEMLFEVVEGGSRQLEFWPFYFRNDYAAVEQLEPAPRRGRDLALSAETDSGTPTVRGDVGPESPGARFPGSLPATKVRPD